MRKLQIISINHLSHSTAERMAFDLKKDQWAELFAYMKYSLHVEGYVHLSTCNRIEIYFESEEDNRMLIIEKWIALSATKSRSISSFETFIESSDCIRYLLQLSVGLHSVIPGDDQILSQLKKQFQNASREGRLSTLLERAFQTIMKSHKQICKETDYRKQTISLAYHSLKSIYKHISVDELASKKLLILGAGDMAAQVVKYLDKFTFGSVTICNRTLDRAERLAEPKKLSVIPYDCLNSSDFDVIISCTDFGYDMVEEMMDLDYYIDLSLMSHAISDINIPHLRLPELQEFINSENEKRFSSLDSVKAILEEHANSFSNWVLSWESRSATKRPCISI